MPKTPARGKRKETAKSSAQAGKGGSRPGKKGLPRKPASKTPVARQLRQVEEQLAAVRALGGVLARTVGLDSLLEEIVPHVSDLMAAERTTLFLYDPASEEIWSKVAQGEKLREIRLSLGQGLAGWAAQHREVVNVPDAYGDARFNPDVDARTGFRTRTVAVAPLMGRDGELRGVLQVLNRKTGVFDEEDIELLRSIAAQTTYAVENAHLSQQILDQNRELEASRARAERRRAELDLLYQLEQETSASTDLDELLDSIIVRVCERMRSEAGSVLLTDKDTGRLYFRGVSGTRKQELKQMALEPGEGVVGWVAQHGEPMVVNRPEEDPRHNGDLAKRIDYPANALLAVPLIWDRRVIGAVEVLNPRPRLTGAVGYDLEDLKVLTLIAGQVARAVALTRERQARIDTERLAVVGRMLAGVAHDLRNPMTAISGYAQLMAMDEDPDVRQQRCERILVQVDEMTAMITDLLAFSRGDTRLHPVTLSISQLTHETEQALRGQCEPRGILLLVQGQGGSVTVDGGRVRRVLYNLARNAIDALGSGGTLSIELREKEGDLELQVMDDGPGIPDEIRARLFDPFVTAGKPHGTGLGLSIVKRFVSDHGGRISVESRADQGTCFIVHLPRVTRESNQQEST